MPLHLEAGATPIAGYALARLLGRGGFGEVWEASAPGGIRVALKFIRLDSVEGSVEQRALEVIRDIRHPHLLDVQFAVRVEDCLVIAMPLCDESLTDRLHACQARGLPGLPRGELLRYMEELARAVDFLNEPRHRVGPEGRVGVQHRDIKPRNIFLVGDSVRLADFGLAKVLESSSATHTGSMSPRYVAPEMLEGRVSQWSDQYSLAVSYVELRTGRLPFEGRTVNELLYAHIHLVPDLSGLPEAERGAVARALAKQPEQRWPTCRAFVRALESSRGEDGRPTAASGSTLVATGSPTVGTTRLPESPGIAQPSSTRSYGAGSPIANEERAASLPRRPHRLRLVGLAGLTAVLAAVSAGLLIPQAAPTTPKKPAPGPIATSGSSPAATGTAPPFTRTGGDGRSGRQTPARPAPDPAHEAVLADPASGPVASAETPIATEPLPADALAHRARAILKAYCYRCHGVRFEVPGYNVLDRDLLVAKRGEEEPPYVVPGKPDDSYLWQRVGVDGDMPPSGPKPSSTERALIARWIAAGAPFPRADPATRPRRTEADVLAAISDHLKRARPSDRAYLRYFTLHNLHDNKDVDDADLRLARAAVAKLVNSLSWKAEIVVPKPIDPEQVVMAFDLRDVGWDERDLWQVILTRYPYGLKHDQDPDARVRALAEEAYELAGTSIPSLRADWFVANAARPPLYHILLDLPQDDRSLERRFGVDVEADFLHDKLARAGFATSGVSSQNRLVERHPALYGAYWKSYDFRRNGGSANLYRFPLGPAFAGNPFPNQAFEHAGGEILFHLPNGLQGYLLVDGTGRRIDAGPVEVVGDALRTSGTAAIVTGLSCMACHRHGLVTFVDTVREGLAVAGEPRDKSERLYPARDVMDQLVRKDEARFLKALDAAAGVFLKVGEDENKSIREFAEPIGALARGYLKDLGPAEVAADLGFNDPKEMVDMIRASSRLRELGLAPLLHNAAIKRTEWDSLDGRFLSRYQEAARELELGTPHRSF